MSALGGGMVEGDALVMICAGFMLAALLVTALYYRLVVRLMGLMRRARLVTKRVRGERDFYRLQRDDYHRQLITVKDEREAYRRELTGPVNAPVRVVPPLPPDPDRESA